MLANQDIDHSALASLDLYLKRYDVKKKRHLVVTLILVKVEALILLPSLSKVYKWKMMVHVKQIIKPVQTIL